MGKKPLERIVRRPITHQKFARPNNNAPIPVYYDKVDPSRIFGMVGRCGGGYNTIWSDWSPAGRSVREKIIKEFEDGMNKICGHYKKLEASILEHGIRDPVIITCGWPVRKKMHHLPPELINKPPVQRLLLEGTTGGSRLWVAQRHRIPVPCIINDFSRNYNNGEPLRTIQEVVSHYGDPPAQITMTPRAGVNVPFDPTKSGFHMGGKWREDEMVKQRAPLWVSIMNKYGYYVAGLNAHVNQILKDAGVIQPAYLKQAYETELTMQRNRGNR